MRIVRVARPDGPAFGVLQAGPPDDEASGVYVRLLDGHPFAGIELTEQIAPLEAVQLLAPIIPSKILCVGKNYADHAKEMGGEVPDEPLIFSKPATAVIGPRAAIRLPALSEEVHHEAELAVVIGRLTRNVAVADALDHVLGYTCANDVTARDLQRRDGQWVRAKGFDTFCPLGPWIETELADPAALDVTCRVNGEVRQSGSTADLVFSIAELIAHIAAFTTLLPGDVVLTGTPAGVGPLVDGDVVEVEITGLGLLANPVLAED